jgi:mannose/fructose-specific phosphotransferase system component IIA
MWAASLKNAVLIYLWQVLGGSLNNALLHYEKNNDENIVSGVSIQIFNSSSNFNFTEKFRN